MRISDWSSDVCSSDLPWIATRDEFGDNQPDLAMIARTNVIITTSGRSSGMRLDINRLLEELSWRTALSPGDLFFSGTPGYKDIPDGVVGPGDEFEFEIEGIGVLKNRAEIRNQPPGQQADFSTTLGGDTKRSEEHTSELQSLMRISYSVFCLKKKKP